MIQYRIQKRRCVCEIGGDAHSQHARPRNATALRGDFRCPHWDWVTSEAYRESIEAATVKYHEARRAKHPRVVAPVVG